jgi:hypothetical protein
MTRRKWLAAAGRLATLAIGAAGLAACARTAPVYNVSNAGFVGGGSMAQRNQQIKRAGAGLGWIMEDMGPNLIRATLNLRSHQALVDIRYDQGGFSMRYANSTNLNYDGTTIHRNYNGWVQRLEQHIIAESAVT